MNNGDEEADNYIYMYICVVCACVCVCVLVGHDFFFLNLT